MKKLLLLAFATSFMGLTAQVSTCSLDPAFIASNKKGIWPDSATNFVSGTVGIPYYQNLTIKVPKDTVVNPLTMCFNRIEVSSPTGITNFNLPAGINILGGNNVTVTAGTFKFPGNANTCAEISGTPNTAGTYFLQFKVQPFVSPAVISCPSNPNVSGGSSNFAQPTTLLYYKIVINPPAGVKEIVSKKSFALELFPNPASAKTHISFIVEDEADVNITVQNMLGSRVAEISNRTHVGENNITVNCSDWKSGIYFCTTRYKNHTETKRLIVNQGNE